MQGDNSQMMWARIFRVVMWVIFYSIPVAFVRNIYALDAIQGSASSVPVPWYALAIAFIAMMILLPVANNLPLAIIAGHPGWSWRNRRNLQSFAKGGPRAMELVKRSGAKAAGGLLVAMIAAIAMMNFGGIFINVLLALLFVAGITVMVEGGPAGLRERIMRSQTPGGQEPA